MIFYLYAANMFIKELFPAPDGPKMAAISPVRKVPEIPSRMIFFSVPMSK